MKHLVRVYTLLIVLQLLLILASWLLSAWNPESGVRSLLSGEGLRWLLGGYAHRVVSPFLGVMVLVAVGWGAVLSSGLWHSLLHFRRCGYRERSALRHAFCALLAIWIVLVIFLLPQPTQLLSATGSLFPSPLIRSIPLLVCLSLSLPSLVYSVISDSTCTARRLYALLFYGLRRSIPWLFLYVLVYQLYVTVCFVWGVD